MQKVSIVIPTYNRAEYLKQAIDASLAQTTPCEIIVCDHGSTDNTQKVARSYGDKIKYIRRDCDHGVHFNWLDAIINANNELIHLNYDDDWIAPDFIEKTLKLFNQDTGVVFTAVNIVDEKGEKISEEFINLFPEGINPSNKLEKHLLRNGGLISPGCCLFRKQDMIDWLFVGNIPGTTDHYKGVGPDLLFALGPILKYRKFGFVDQKLAFFRAHDKSITIDSRKDAGKFQRIQNAYNASKAFYLVLKLSSKLRINKFLFIFYNYVILLPDKVINKISRLTTYK